MEQCKALRALQLHRDRTLQHVERRPKSCRRSVILVTIGLFAAGAAAKLQLSAAAFLQCGATPEPRPEAAPRTPASSSGPPVAAQSRRALAASAALVAAAGSLGAPGLAGAETAGAEAPSAPPSWIEELRPWPSGLPWDSAKAPEIKWKPFVGETADPCADSLVYPSWLEGTWKVEYKKNDIRLPQGWGRMNSQLPGVAMASVLRLPNVGAEPKDVRWRFETSGGAVRPDWSVQLPSLLESFWADAKVTRPLERQAGQGWALTYKSPTAGGGKRLTERSVTLSWLSSAAWTDPVDGGAISAEWIRQRDELAGPQGVMDYKVLTVIRRVNASDTDDKAEGLLRVAGFLQPIDDAYVESNGSACVVYDYSLTLTRMNSTV